MFRNFLFILFSQFVVISAMAGGLRVGLSPDYPPLVFKQEGASSVSKPII